MHRIIYVENKLIVFVFAENKLDSTEVNMPLLTLNFIIESCKTYIDPLHKSEKLENFLIGLRIHLDYLSYLLICFFQESEPFVS